MSHDANRQDGDTRGVAPFILTDLVRRAVLVAFPWLVLFLPTTMG
jgi:hypothetical protein